MSKICLVIIFNHKYNKNIIRLQDIYGKRFDNIYYIVPFNTEIVDGVDVKHVISVYETSYCFQGYLAQAYDKISDSNYSHYVVIGDDQILNPFLNQENIVNELGLAENESFIKEIIPFHKSSGDQGYKLFNILAGFRMNVGVSHKGEFPTCEEATKKCESKNIEVSKKITFKYLAHKGFLSPKFLLLTLMSIIINKGIKLPYPLFKAYSDIMIINQHAMEEFCRLSGVFAAMNMFVETAIPLAMVLACDRIKVEGDINGYYGVEKWRDEIPVFESKYNNDLTNLFSNFGEKVLYYHPIKLSRWK